MARPLKPSKQSPQQKQSKRPKECYPTDLTDKEWAIIRSLIPPKEGPGPPRTVDLREVVNALLYLVHTGCQWRMLPKEFPPWQTVRYYFDKWTEDGTWLKMMDALRREVRRGQGRRAERSAGIMDTQSVKTTESGGERGWDGGKKVKGRKRHLVVDVEGWPLVIWVHAADLMDREGAEGVLRRLKERFPGLRKVWVDAAYLGELVEWAKEALGIELEVVKRPRGRKGFVLLPRRWVVERSFGWLNRYRRLSKDFESWVEFSESMIMIAFIHIMVRRLAKHA